MKKVFADFIAIVFIVLMLALISFVLQQSIQAIFEIEFGYYKATAVVVVFLLFKILSEINFF